MLSDINHKGVAEAMLISKKKNWLLRQQLLLNTEKDILVDEKISS